MVAAGVDVAARRRGAQVLRDFLAGRMTNFAFEAACPDSDDPVIEAVWESAWVLYDDFKTHRLAGRFRLYPDERRGMLRWVLFLDSALPYTWPSLAHPAFPPRAVEQSVVRRLFFGDQRGAEAVRRFMAHGHFAVWPFARVADFKAALANPRRLAGRR